MNFTFYLNHLKSTLSCFPYFPLETIFYLVGTITRSKSLKERNNYFLFITEPFLYSFMKKKYDVAIDVGAHKGKYSGFFSFFSKKVYSFEPTPSTFKELKNNMKNFKNVEVIQKVVSDKNQKVNFYLNQESVKNSFVIKSSEKIVLDSITLDYFVFNNSIENISIIKIDTEGAEHLILKGAKRVLESFKPELIIEFHNNKEKVLSILKKSNYEYEMIKENESGFFGWNNHGWLYARACNH